MGNYLLFPYSYYFMKEFSIAVKAFIVKGDKLLLIKRSSDDVHKPGVWEIPGGRLDSEAEDPYDGLKRETKEEVSLDIDILHPLQIDHFTREDGQKITMLIFLCTTKNSFSDVQLSEEHSDYRWVNIDSAEDILVGFFHEGLKRYKKYFLKN